MSQSVQPSLAVRTASPADQQAVVSTIVMAFSTDPAARWVYPDAQSYFSHFPEFVRAFGGKAFSHDSAHFIPRYEGAALWLPPGVHPDDEHLQSVIDTTVAASVRDDLNAVFEQMAGFHPEAPHWYLPMIGVDVRCQSRGHGSALLAHALAACDRDRLPAYLESSNPRNITLYHRHGFRLMGIIQAGSSPPLFPMLRHAR